MKKKKQKEVEKPFMAEETHTEIKYNLYGDTTATLKSIDGQIESLCFYTPSFCGGQYMSVDSNDELLKLKEVVDNVVARVVGVL